MAKLRPASCHRRIKRAYTRTSKYRRLSYIKGAPNHKIIHFDSGNRRYEMFPKTIVLNADKAINLRHNAIEAARIVVTRHMSKNVGKFAFGLKLKVFPHHIIRENPIAMGAGADRMSQGMRSAFGKTISRAARVKPDQTIIQVYIQEENVKDAKRALEKASKKFGISCTIRTLDNPLYVGAEAAALIKPKFREAAPKAEEETTEEAETTEDAENKEEETTEEATA
ncbi:MAG: 50S ribosomal protein L16 [Candidatus Nanoarchaeia archaeon]|nr:50S ribosomal protein L16 [Candidatus Nanoarchaeia archaeon]